MLHLIYQSPFNASSLNNCLTAFETQDSLLLIENGIFCALSGTLASERLIELTNQQKVFVLAPHAIERGVLSQLIQGTQLIDFNRFVDLTVECERVFRW
jgi:tRNA 2-thiouridine synthesizing protein B